MVGASAELPSRDAVAAHPANADVLPVDRSRFVPLDSENHAVLADEPAWAKFVGEMEPFLAEE